MLDFPVLGSLYYIELASRDPFSVFGIVHEFLVVCIKIVLTAILIWFTVFSPLLLIQNNW